MKNIRFCIMALVVAGWLAATQGPALGDEVKLGDLNGLVGQWMSLRTALADESREWTARESQWQEEIALLEQEAGTLQKELDETREFSSSVEKTRSVVLARQEQGKKELKELQEVLARAEADLRKWKKQLPSGLRENLAAGFRLLPAGRDEAENLPLTKRAQTIVVLYTQIESLLNEFHGVSETLELDGVRRQVNVLYMGLAVGMAVSPTGDWAAVGIPGESGWGWTPVLDQAEAYARAMDIFNRQETAQLVELSMPKLKEVTP